MAEITKSAANPAPPVVVIEDDATMLEILRGILHENGLNPVTFTHGAEAIAYIKRQPAVGAMLIDISLPDMDGIELLRETRKIRNSVPCFILTARDDAKSAVTAMKAGADDYFTKPFQPPDLVATLRAAVAAGPGTPDACKDAVVDHDRWKSARMKAALEAARRAARTNHPVMIRGANGTGKNMFARLIHESAGPARKPFHRINLAAISEARLEVELFGHSVSSPESQIHPSAGRLEKSRGSTLFLQNIDALGLRAQAALVDWLMLNPPAAPGSRGMRLICSTSADVDKLMESGDFRSDLWFLLAVHQIEVPTLAERAEDIPTLCEDILTTICVKGRLRRPTLTRKALEVIQDYPWPHNLMELHNALEHAVVNTPDGLISPANLPRFVQSGQPSAAGQEIGKFGVSSIEEVTRTSLVAALEACGGNRRRAAQRLRVSLRTIYNMIKRYDLVETGARKGRPGRNPA